jgi:hypothetical protein
MASQGWLDEVRVWKSIGDFDETIPLRPLHRHSLHGYLAARVGPFLVEYRAREFWDDNDGFPVVLIHRFQDGRSYVMSSTNRKQGLNAADVFQWNSPLFRIRVEVVQIDEPNRTAYVRLQFTSLFRRLPHFEPGHLIGGVASDGGGYVVIGGHVVPIPPRSPAAALLERAVSLHDAEAHEDNAIGEQVLKLFQAKRAQADEASGSPFRQPAKVK